MSELIELLRRLVPDSMGYLRVEMEDRDRLRAALEAGEKLREALEQANGPGISRSECHRRLAEFDQITTNIDALIAAVDDLYGTSDKGTT
jgi:hypothetical protein